MREEDRASDTLIRKIKERYSPLSEVYRTFDNRCFDVGEQTGPRNNILPIFPSQSEESWFVLKSCI